MLELTVLQRYNKNGKRFCELIGIMRIDFENRKIIGDQSTVIFNKKYSDLKSIICKEFTSGKSQKEISREIRKNGMKITETKFTANEDIQTVILIED